MQECLVCPAGHQQSKQRDDRLGRCTTCGGILVKAWYDETLKTETIGSDGMLTAKEDT